MQRKPRILIIEDEAAISEPLAESLAREGFSPVVAATGAAALDAFVAEAPDLLLLDLMLPDIDGREVCRDIRSRTATRIIMLTAWGEEVDRILGLELGADGYIVKPFSAREVAARIRAVLRRSRAAGGRGDRGRRCAPRRRVAHRDEAREGAGTYGPRIRPLAHADV